jgi:hypothetical protein
MEKELYPHKQNREEQWNYLAKAGVWGRYPVLTNGRVVAQNPTTYLTKPNITKDTGALCITAGPFLFFSFQRIKYLFMIGV